MKTIYKKMNQFILVMATLVSCASQAAFVELQASDLDIMVGDTFTVDVVLSGPFQGLPADIFLTSFGFDLNVSPTNVLGDAQVSVGADWFQVFGLDADVAGLSQSLWGIDDTSLSSITLATLTFTALEAGEAVIDVFGDFQNWGNQGLTYMNALGEFVLLGIVADLTLSVSSVPEPATWLLLLSSVGFLVARRR